ncbi:UV radiation resistance associated gene [Cyberlindnera jadinii]|uniref:UV radiation resistance associated protein n=1 Tax=Cyberlindnera jadinii (strain ATCC 18201 / CBS 1600 / BCRC 20928 / JCM 3617 / NBRC 0987 / NRRL Y-1542) TaxID=983966 RepID=A0A0H5BY13_CYBJN|nr:UV radiation resistance associated gene [Cyberlindnera jadinii]
MTIQINTDGCVLHPKRRKIRHIRGLSVYNITSAVGGSQRPLSGDLDEKQLQALNHRSFFSAFCSLHYSSGVPFHVSEVHHGCIDVEFQEFDLYGIAGSDEHNIIVKIWVTNEADEDDDSWTLLMQLDFSLRALLFCDEPIGDNCVMMNLVDGKYIVPTNDIDLLWYSHVLKRSTPVRKVASLNYDMLMKLNSIQLSLEDLKVSKAKLAKRISEDGVEKGVASYRELKLRDMISSAKQELESKRERLQNLRSLREIKLKQIQGLRTSRQLQLEQLDQERGDFSNLLIQHETTLNEFTVERTKVIKEVKSIFPLEDIAHWLEIPEFDLLPRSVSLHHIESPIHNEINAALGYLAHMTLLLSHYLAVPLRYKIQFFGSYSIITDDVSQIRQRRVFPLFFTQHYPQFQYGVLLLVANMKDIMEENYLQY